MLDSYDKFYYVETKGNNKIGNLYEENDVNGNIDTYQGFNPWYVTGITDAEGSFQITIQDIKGRGNTGYKPFLEFKITQNKYSIDMLLKLKKFFNCGRINVDNRNTSTLKFVITNNDDIVEKLISYFDSYSLITSKWLNYNDF